MQKTTTNRSRVIAATLLVTAAAAAATYYLCTRYWDVQKQDQPSTDEQSTQAHAEEEEEDSLSSSSLAEGQLYTNGRCRDGAQCSDSGKCCDNREPSNENQCACGNENGGCCHDRASWKDSAEGEEEEIINAEGEINDCGANELEDIKPHIDYKASLESRVAPILAMDDVRGIGCIPEETSVYVKTFGCSHNMSDSEVMMGLLKQAGFSLVDKWEDADVSVLNSCTVKNPSQDGAVNLAMKIKAAGRGVVVSGCVVQADDTIPQLQNISSLGVKQIDKVVEAVMETAMGNVYKSMSVRRDLPKLNLPKVRRNKLIEIIPLSTGCLGACTYCKTRYARGVLGSYAMEAILDRVKQAVNEGVQQIWLTSEDTGAYGLDIGTNIAELLERIVELLSDLRATASDRSSKHVMVRLGMTNPPYMLAHLDRLAKVLRSDHFFEFLHIPVQSGSNHVLEGMNREYTVEEFHQCASGLLKEVPHLLLATDFICGFPNEREEDHRESIDLLLHYKFPSLNISQFYPRPGTPAAKMKRVPTHIVKSRSQEMTKAFFEYTTFEPYVGTTGMVWFSGVSEKSDHVVGHTKQYIKVLVDRDDNLIGTHRICRFTDCSKWHLIGELVSL